MTNQEALTELRASIEGCGFQCHIETYRSAIGALEKQVPLKPIYEGDDEQDHILCPCCKKIVGVVDDYYGENGLNRFCFNCGQALDWGDKE